MLFHKAVSPGRPRLFFFFCHNNSIAGASSVAMETNVESQLWFCFRGPLGWSTVGTLSLTPAFLSAPRTRGG